MKRYRKSYKARPKRPARVQQRARVTYRAASRPRAIHPYATMGLLRTADYPMQWRQLRQDLRYEYPLHPMDAEAKMKRDAYEAKMKIKAKTFLTEDFDTEITNHGAGLQIAFTNAENDMKSKKADYEANSGDAMKKADYESAKKLYDDLYESKDNFDAFNAYKKSMSRRRRHTATALMNFYSKPTKRRSGRR